jgi:uncharacterized protein (DUF362 family)
LIPVLYDIHNSVAAWKPNDRENKEVMSMRQRRRNSPDVGIALNQDESTAIREALGHIQAGNLIHKDDVVVITPNWVQQQDPRTGIVVGPESLREVLRFVKESNPRRIAVATGSGQKSTLEIMQAVGYDTVIRSEGVEFIDLNTGPFERVQLKHHSPSATNINRIYGEMTFLISFAQLKYHEEATITGCVKNVALGWPPAEEHGYPKKNLGIHTDLHGFIRAMAESITIDLSILSCNPAMIATGPAKGIPKHTGLVLAGTDPVAVDTIGARFLGFKPQGVRHLYECVNSNIGIGDSEKINIKGLSLVDAERTFSTAAYGEQVLVDGK